jgi:hypothetical protein
MSAESASTTDETIEVRLERGDVVFFPTCPFALPTGDDLDFLLRQRQGRLAKNISYNPHNGAAGGFVQEDPAQAERLRRLLAQFAETTTRWVAEALPGYAGGCRPDRVSYRPLEEATRRLRQTARNDLIHVDAFPSRPARDHRILRVFANVNPTEPRIWVTSDPFKKLLERYGAEAGLPGRHVSGWMEQVSQGLLSVFRPNVRRRTVCDAFMLRFHDYLKANEEFQERGPKRLWSFPPGSAWLALTDACSHAVLRGRFALEHSYFIAPEFQALPDESPAALLARMSGAPLGRRAA